MRFVFHHRSRGGESKPRSGLRRNKSAKIEQPGSWQSVSASAAGEAGEGHGTHGRALGRTRQVGVIRLPDTVHKDQKGHIAANEY